MPALAEIPRGANVLVLSRADPQPAYAPSFLGHVIAMLTWQDLRLALQETATLAARNGVTDPQSVHRLHEQAGGWIAGLTWMLERPYGEGGVNEVVHDGVDTIFECIAGLMFDHTPQEVREVLMKNAFLPQVSPQKAEAVTGMPGSIRYLEDLHRRLHG